MCGLRNQRSGRWYYPRAVEITARPWPSVWLLVLPWALAFGRALTFGLGAGSFTTAAALAFAVDFLAAPFLPFGTITLPFSASSATACSSVKSPNSTPRGRLATTFPHCA